MQSLTHRHRVIFISSALCSLSEKRVRSVVGLPSPRSNFKGHFFCLKMNISLDKYLTTEPDNGYDSWFESVCLGLSKPVCEWDDAANNDPCCSEEFTKLCELMFNAGVHHAVAAMLVNQSFNFFEKWIRVNDNAPGFDPKDYCDLLQITR